MYLYKELCPSIDLSVGWSVRYSILKYRENRAEDDKISGKFLIWIHSFINASVHKFALLFQILLMFRVKINNYFIPVNG